MSFLKALKVVEAIGGQLLQAGNHVVTIVRAQETTSNVKNFAGELKEKETPWADAGNQLLVQFASKEGVHVERLNAQGFVRWEDLPDNIRKAGKLKIDGVTYECTSMKTENSDNYACIRKDKNSPWTRLEDKDKTAKAVNRIMQFFAAIQAEVGESAEDALQAAIENKTELSVTIKSKDFEGKSYNEISSFRKVTA